jgi:hypothetical protein
MPSPTMPSAKRIQKLLKTGPLPEGARGEAKHVCHLSHGLLRPPKVECSKHLNEGVRTDGPVKSDPFDLNSLTMLFSFPLPGIHNVDCCGILDPLLDDSHLSFLQIFTPQGTLS